MMAKGPQSLGWLRTPACGLEVEAPGEEAPEAGRALLATVRNLDLVLRVMGEPSVNDYKQGHVSVRFKGLDTQCGCRKGSTMEGVCVEAENREQAMAVG